MSSYKSNNSCNNTRFSIIFSIENQLGLIFQINLMANVIVSNVFQIISLIFIIITLFPQAFLNYRLKNTKHFSKITIILIVLGAQVTLTYLIWSKELIIISIAFGIFIGIGLFIGCQLIYYEEKNQLILLNKLTKKTLLIKRLRFLGNYILFLIWSTTNGLALYFIFELTKFKSWIPQAIGAIVPVVIDSVTYIPQIILIIRLKSTVGCSLLAIITELLASGSGIISSCLQEYFDIVPIITFIAIFISQIVMLILKLIIFPNKKETSSQVQANTQSQGK